MEWERGNGLVEHLAQTRSGKKKCHEDKDLLICPKEKRK
jgi:hypothetical protein